MVTKVKTGQGKNPWRDKRVSLKTKNRVVAQKRLNKLQIENIDEVRNCYVEDWLVIFERTLQTEELDSKTRDKYLCHSKVFIEFVVSRMRYLKDIKYHNIIDFKASLQHSSSTISGYMRSLGKMFKVAERLGYIIKNPMKDVPVGKIEQRLDFFSQDQIRNILMAVQGDDYGKALILFFLQTGFRIEEVVNSYWEKIDENLRIITVVGKYKKKRIQKLPKQTYEAIQHLKGRGKTIFGKEQKQMYRDVKKILQRAGVEGHPHMFRDSYATYFLKVNKDIAALRDRLGHSSFKQTNKYAHAINTYIDDDIKALFNDWEIKYEN